MDSVQLDLAKDFNRKDFISGEPISLSQLSDKYVLLDFWGSWCAPCIKGLPQLKSLASRNHENINLISIAFEKEENLPKLESLIRENNLDWYHVREVWEFNNPLNLTKLYHVQVYPTFILIDKSGKIVFRGEGDDGLKMLESRLQNIFGNIKNDL
ncbi:TlpA family protein disulfide reductase [Sphingobacterium micropteri]|uniref:TlpA family protein disulfide reductase n=1 Tax=Sphingobacterium micropteri TaxID=2763501 RepID=UPI00293C09C6|nr:TlpA disulfide reductase family protein [Sphingobacterium micropteri]